MRNTTFGMLTGDVFLEEGLITPEQLQEAIERQFTDGENAPIADVLVEMGLISDGDRIMCLGKAWGVPFADLKEEGPSPEAVACLNTKFAKRFKVLPMSLVDGVLRVAMANPLDVFVIDEIRDQAEREVEPMIAIEADLEAAINEHYRGEGNISGQLEGVISDFEDDMQVIDADADDELSEDELRELGEDAPIVRLANLIINQAVQDGASDIHIEPRKHDLLVRMRVDGVMLESMTLPKKIVAPLTSRFKIVANMDIAEKRAPQDNRISAKVAGRDFDFRVSTLPIVHGEKIVMRVLDKEGINVGMEKLGFMSQNLETLKDMASRSYGIMLVTGPTGSGKSTTLYSLLNETNTGDNNIITIEDPVEYELDSINQCNVNTRAGMTFAAGLRAMLRQDPDVIMVGEMRDKETATIAMEAALTGHLVFSTLHTNDAPGAATRLTEMGVEPFLIASSIIGVLAQRLVRTICPKCKEEYKVNRQELIRKGFPVPEEACDGAEELTLYRGTGCDKCKDSGYKGRTGVHELLVVDDGVRDAILNSSPSHVIRHKGLEAGMTTLKDDAMAKILAGMTSVEEAVRVLYS